MTELKSEKNALDKIRAFYVSDIYPALICLLVFIGSVSALEFYTNIIHTAFMIGALVLCRTIRPFIISMCTYIYQVSLPHSPNYPNYSNYYYTGWRLPVAMVIISAIVCAIAFFIVKNKLYAKISFKQTPLLLPLLILSAALLLNGAFSSGWKIGGVGMAAAHVAVYLFAFLFIYYGLEGESTWEMARYFAYITMLIALVISGELIHLFVTSDSIFADGSIVKTSVALGWGIWNLVAVSLAVLIPVLFFGVMNNRYPWLYFAVATLAFVMSVLTMSRNALVFSTLAYVACVLICCFVGKYKKIFRIITVAGILLVAAFTVILWDKLQGLLADYFERGFSDNGRFALWRQAFDNFLSAPVFGRGFCGFDVDTAVFGPLPKQAHNTVIQLLSATGIVGLLAYVYYRAKTLKPFFKRPTLMKSFLGISILVLLAESLLDNFVFNVYPVLYYSVTLAIVYRAFEEESIELADDFFSMSTE